MAQQAGQRCKGKVISFNNTRGFGFIKPDDGRDDVFVHHSSIQSEGFRTLPKGAIVEFSYDDSEGNKSKAVDVTLVNHPSNRFGGGGGGGGGGECYKCGAHGHLARNCTNGGGGDGGCYNCGDHGHLARNCTAERESGPTGGGGVGDAACYNCGKTGHFARECRNSGRSIECYTCGGVGHFARECPSQSTDRGDKCFECGKHGHFARNCPLKK